MKKKAQIKKLKKELAGYRAMAFAAPQFGHGRLLTDGEKLFVATMRQTEPMYCLPSGRPEWVCS